VVLNLILQAPPSRSWLPKQFGYGGALACLLLAVGLERGYLL
jgi:hypothetical protein